MKYFMYKHVLFLCTVLSYFCDHLCAACLIESGQVLALNIKKLGQKKLTKQWLVAARDGQLSVLQKLINKVNVNAPTKRVRWVALMYAASRGDTDTIKLLLECPSININAQDIEGNTSLIWAAAGGHAEVVKLLLQGPEIHSIVSDNEKTITSDRHSITKDRLSRKKNLINVNIQNRYGFSALIWAAYKGHHNVVELLLEYPGINLILQDLRGKDAMKAAAENGYLDLARLIKNRLTFLESQAFESIKHNDLEKLRIIISQIGDKITDNEGNTLLHKAFYYNKPDIVIFLFQQSKNLYSMLDARNKSGQIPLELVNPTSPLFELCMELAFLDKSNLISTIVDFVNQQISKICSFCTKFGCIKRCSLCKSAYYCCEECQMAHWAVHKCDCKKSA